MEMAGPIYRSAALGEGIGDYQLRRMVVTEQLRRVRPGAFVAPSSLVGLFLEARHRIELEATARALKAPAVISHVSAAVMHGLPVWNLDLRRARFTRSQGSGGYSTRWFQMHATQLDEGDISMVDGAAVTSVARTVADLARSVPFEQAVVTGDGALNMGLVTAPELGETQAKLRGRYGSRAAAQAIAFMDRRSESAGESRSRVIMHRLGLPPPDLQRVIRRGGAHLGRVDFCMVEHGVIGEFDGLGKYERGRRPGESSGDVLAREKSREDELRATGAIVVRWLWRDLGHPKLIAAKFEDAFVITRRLPPPDWDQSRPGDDYIVRMSG